ncbi:helix-turn-helix domain-containing protein [Mucilaginibacter aquatilis]|uniref:DNA-binding protein n=1 Tax=Mucilaginibacter aquatilis TaxID=1517760 RepID=A0A6I4IBR9_9SPHI|nr:helix-turn-helix domain-containing protein [Mucilaginibacter aquatilis]MVN92665.1 hypothetical protein [Mucilaginibacter aquatilis]
MRCRKSSSTELNQTERLTKQGKTKATEIINCEDLEAFGEKLISQIKALLTVGSTEGEPRKWIKTCQVKKVLTISINTLQTLCDKGTIPFTKIGGILYYEMDAIQKVLRSEAVQTYPFGEVKTVFTKWSKPCFRYA